MPAGRIVQFWPAEGVRVGGDPLFHDHSWLPAGRVKGYIKHERKRLWKHVPMRLALSRVLKRQPGRTMHLVFLPCGARPDGKPAAELFSIDHRRNMVSCAAISRAVYPQAFKLPG